MRTASATLLAICCLTSSVLGHVIIHGVGDPGVIQPGAIQPGVIQPGVIQPGVLQPAPVGPGAPGPPVFVSHYPGGPFFPGQGPQVVLVPFGPGLLPPEGEGGHHGPTVIEEVTPVLKNVPSVDDDERKTRGKCSKCNSVDNKKGIPPPNTSHKNNGRDLDTSETRRKRMHEKEGPRRSRSKVTHNHRNGKTERITAV